MSHLLRLIIERIRQTISHFAICVLLQIREPLLIELVKNVITHKSRKKVKVKRQKSGGSHIKLRSGSAASLLPFYLFTSTFFTSPF